MNLQAFNNLPSGDRSFVIETLQAFQKAAAPVGHPDPFYAGSEDFAKPAGGWDEAYRLYLAVEKILDGYYVDWRLRHLEGRYKYDRELDAIVKLLHELTDETVVRISQIVDSAPSLSALELHRQVWDAAKPNWEIRQFASAVDAVARYVNSMIQAKVDRTDLSESKLLRQVFSEAAPEVGKHRLRFNEFTDAQTQETMRVGVMSYGSGCFSAIRNPLAHRPDEEIKMKEPEALERLVAFSLLARWIDEAVVDTP